MKLNKSLLLSFALLVLAASLYRAFPGRPFGFAPQMAMALFGGAVIGNKKWAMVLPLLSMLISDLVYQALYINGLSSIEGFYAGQWVNYGLIALMTLFGFLLKKITALRVAAFSLSGSVIYFLLSNFTVWAAGAGYARPKTFEGLMMCYADGLAFLRDYGVFQGFWGNLFIGDLFFTAILFGSFFFVQRNVLQQKTALA